MEVQELTKKELDLNEYFNWLRVYTNKHQKIRTDIWTELNLSDANHIYELKTFFEKIDNYAKNNFLEANINKDEISYNIKDDDIFYKISFNEYYDYYYINRGIEESNFIEAKGIIENKFSKKSRFLNKKIEIFESYLIEILASGVNPDIIEEKTRKILMRMKK